MEKQRKYKMFSIIALMFAVVALSVGFAAFNKTLNISSSASARLLNEKDFDVELYGVLGLFDSSLEFNQIDASLLSKTEAHAWDTNNKFYQEYSATINSEEFTINITNLELQKQGNEFYYTFLLKNNSPYGVYVYLSESSKNSFDNGWLPHSCDALEQTSQNIVDEICNSINVLVGPDSYYDVQKFLDGRYLISPNDYDIIHLRVYKKDDNLVDSPVLVNFEPIKLEIGFTPASYYNTTSTNEDA